MKNVSMAVIAVFLALAPGLVAAKSVKWSCVALNPLNPFSYTCFASTRP